MSKLKKILLPFFSILFTIPSMAQTVAADSGDNHGFMQSNDKIYVVMVIVTTILAGLIFYVARLDKKISKLEKESN